jgi:hypothetical protein
MTVELIVTPADALIDVPRRIAAQGLQPGELITLHSHTVRGPGVHWNASAAFQADATGTVDLMRDAPQTAAPSDAPPGTDAGSYTTASPMGLIWSQRPELSPDAARAWASRDVFGGLAGQQPGGAPGHADPSGAIWRHRGQRHAHPAADGPTA